MWRSFFLAFGTFAIIVGFETMVVDQFAMTNVRRIPKIVTVTARNLVNPASPSGGQNLRVSAPQNSYQMPTLNRPLVPGPSVTGPARYTGTQSATFNRIQDPTVSKYGSPQQSGLGFAGFQKGSEISTSPPMAAIPTPNFSLRQPRLIQTADWMPWSLLAAGTIIVLYTQSIGGKDE